MQHNHPINPISFVHCIINDDTKNVIKNMSKANINSTKISEFLFYDKNINITATQVSSITAPKIQKEQNLETDLLINKMENEKGSYFVFPPEEIGKTNYRRGVATFTQEEMKNLHNFGDFVCIDPTYRGLKNNWTMISISLIGRNRELRSGGIVFCSNVTSDIFEWIMKLLAYKLPSSNMIKTICLDDDLMLNSTYHNLKNDPKCTKIARIVCIWHKLCLFTDIVNQMSIPKAEKDILIHKFDELVFTKNTEKCLTLISELKKFDNINEFFNKSFKDRLGTSTKAFTKNVWSLGYLSNIFSECNNSNIKNLCGSHLLSLVDMRNIITRADQRRMMNREYFKGRNLCKISDKRIFEFMKEFNIERRISESIIGSLQKAEDPEKESLEKKRRRMENQCKENRRFFYRYQERSLGMQLW